MAGTHLRGVRLIFTGIEATKANSTDGSEIRPYQYVDLNVSAHAPCRFRSRICAAPQFDQRFLPPFARAAYADACSADNRPARCV